MPVPRDRRILETRVHLASRLCTASMFSDGDGGKVKERMEVTVLLYDGGGREMLWYCMYISRALEASSLFFWF